jgi:AcrR family transcriptional regulator
MTYGHKMTARHASSTPASLAPTARAGRRERRKTEVRQRLFRAALHLFGVRGFSATTVEDITQAADVGKGTFFNYFPTKELLLTEWVELRLDILRASHSEVEQNLLPLRDILRRLFFNLMEEPGRSRGAARCMLLALGSEPVVSLAQGTAARARKILAEMMAAGQKRGEIRKDASAKDLAQLFQQTFFGFMHLWVLLPNQKLSRRMNTAFALFWAAAGVQRARSRESST